MKKKIKLHYIRNVFLATLSQNTTETWHSSIQ